MLKQFYQIILGAAFLCFGLLSCAGESPATQEKVATTPTNTNATANAATQPEVESEVKIDWNASELLIQEVGLAGIFVGQPVYSIEDRVSKGDIKSGDGGFVAYYFKAKDGQPLGYFSLDPEDQSLIGDVVVTSPAAATKNGIKVGSTFSELKAVAPGLEVHGSEIESRTHAYVGRTAYLLDAAFNTYDIDKNQIKPDTRIKEIRLMCNPKKKR